MVILMGKGPTEAKYGLIGWKGLGAEERDMTSEIWDLCIDYSQFFLNSTAVTKKMIRYNIFVWLFMI